MPFPYHRTSFHGSLDASVAATALGLRAAAGNPHAIEDDEGHELDEPPDVHLSHRRKFSFGRIPIQKRHTFHLDSFSKSLSPPEVTPASLLTQALTSPNLRSIDNAMVRGGSNRSIDSGVSTAELTSDGGFTSPARTSSPSPPLPATTHGLALLHSTTLDDLDTTESNSSSRANTFMSVPQATETAQTTPRQASPEPQQQLTRRRCITFACGPRPSSPITRGRSREPKPIGGDESKEVKKSPEPAPLKRACTLRFACPTRPDKSEPAQASAPAKTKLPLSPAPLARLALRTSNREHRDSESTIKDVARVAPKGADVGSTPSSPDAIRSEALRFHEFASSHREDDEWITAGPSARQKITVTDTLRKEIAIRRLGEEAEEEALEEEEDEDDLEDDIEEDEEEEEEDLDDSDGNESDDEHGFAESDDDSEEDSEYQFWTPAITTAATSADHLEPIRPRISRISSQSSMDSATHKSEGAAFERSPARLRRKRKVSPKMRPSTPELPDSTDFVCGTLDEDRPLEEAWASCMKQREIAKKGILPQDLDPSFPTSEPEDDDDDDDDDDNDLPVHLNHSDEGHAWVAGKPDDSDEGLKLPNRRAGKSPAPSPKRLRSPPPKRRKSPAPVPSRARSPAPKRRKSPAPVASRTSPVEEPRRGRSPAPRRLFGTSPLPLRSPPRQQPSSPPCSPRDSPEGSSHKATSISIVIPRLAERPELTHTKSLPRTPNPFWKAHRASRGAADQSDSEAESEAEQEDEDSSSPVTSPAEEVVQSQGPINIKQGLETKRQRRREKFIRQHYSRQTARDKERRCHPGKGARHMREVGLAVADRTRGYGQKPQLVISV